jgi:hypothetical protein
VVGEDDGNEPAVSVGVLLLDSLLRLIGAEAIVDDLVVLVDATLHLGAAAAGEEGEGCGGYEWGGDLG